MLTLFSGTNFRDAPFIGSHRLDFEGRPCTELRIHRLNLQTYKYFTGSVDGENAFLNK